jgi:8-oxo-dGTP diphosphatase
VTGPLPTPNPSSAPRVEVAAAVIQQPDGQFLLAQRPPGKAYAGYWEFPGGKIERGESPVHALRRELQEELGIDVRRAYPWIVRDYDYEHAAVRLRFFRVVEWTGEPHGRENQRLAWQTAGSVSVDPMLPANGPILSSLGLPAEYGISNAASTGADEFLLRLERSLQRGLRLLQIREKEWSEDDLETLTRRALALAKPYGARVLVNGTPAQVLRYGADGVHLTAAALRTARERPCVPVVGASCHDEAELERAAALGVDFVVLGPVSATASHPGAAAMGWEAFARLAADYPLPVYALGGMRHADLAAAWNAGAHGVAMMRGAWLP